MDKVISYPRGEQETDATCKAGCVVFEDLKDFVYAGGSRDPSGTEAVKHGAHE